MLVYLPGQVAAGPAGSGTGLQPLLAWSHFRWKPDSSIGRSNRRTCQWTQFWMFLGGDL